MNFVVIYVQELFLKKVIGCLCWGFAHKNHWKHKTINLIFSNLLQRTIWNFIQKDELEELSILQMVVIEIYNRSLWSHSFLWFLMVMMQRIFNHLCFSWNFMHNICNWWRFTTLGNQTFPMKNISNTMYNGHQLITNYVKLCKFWWPKFLDDVHFICVIFVVLRKSCL
jgi:hypothetical protein